MWIHIMGAYAPMSQSAFPGISVLHIFELYVLRSKIQAMLLGHYKLEAYK
jgi:hypothetical protein